MTVAVLGAVLGEAVGSITSGPCRAFHPNTRTQHSTPEVRSRVPPVPGRCHEGPTSATMTVMSLLVEERPFHISS